MDRLFFTVLNMSFTASMVILAVIVVRLLLKRTPRKFSYLLWGIVLIRLICPVALQADFGLVPNVKLIEAQEEQTDAQRITGVQSTDVRQEVSGEITQTVPEGDENHKQQAGSRPVVFWAEIRKAIAYIWFAGVLLLLAYMMGSYAIFKRKYRDICTKGDTIVISEEVSTPFVAGFKQPVIFLPEGLDKEEQRLIILHERIHIRRRDYLIKPVAFCVASIHWFNPLVWLAFYLMEQDMEASCDEAVLSKGGYEHKKLYARTLLRFAQAPKRTSGCPIAFGENGTKARIENVVKLKKVKNYVWIAGVAAVGLAAVLLLVNDKEATQADSVITDRVEQLPQEEQLLQTQESTEAQTVESASGDMGDMAAENNDEPEAEAQTIANDGDPTLAEAPNEQKTVDIEQEESLKQEEEKRLEEELEKLEAEKKEIEKLVEAEKKNNQIVLDEIQEQIDAQEDAYLSILRNEEGIYEEYGILYRNPVAEAKISNGFGSRTHPLSGEEIMHSGVDLAAEKGTEIVAAAKGEVYETGFDKNAGNYLILLHGNGEMTYYANCDTILVNEGAEVEMGEKIATVGSTGAATGAHLHFAISYRGSYMEPAFKE